MSTPERVSLWLPPVSFVAIAVLVGMISFSPWSLEPIAITGQLCLLLVGLRAFCYWRPMIRWVKRMPIPHRAVFGLLIASIILGHYTINSRTYFPYVAWEIFPFVNEKDPVTCHELIATTASGKKARLLVEQLFPSIVQFDLPNDADYSAPGATERLVHALAKIYNEHHADDPVQSVELVAMAVKLHPPANESRSQPSCELLQHYEISSGR